MNIFRRPILAVVLALVVSSAIATPKPEHPQPEDQAQDTAHLQEVKHTFFDKVKIDSTSSMTAVKKIYLAQAGAEFSRYWLRDHRMDVSNRYKEKTLERFSRILNEELQRAIEKEERFEVVSTRDEADWVFTPKLSKLNIYAPDDSFGKSLVFIAGNARYELQVMDAKSGKVLVQLQDARETADRGYSRPVRATRASNTRDFKMLMRKWSSRSLEYLNSISLEQTA